MVSVWDSFIRIFHWSLVTLFIVAFATGDEIEWLHNWVGYAIAALLALRVVWGFVGTRYARFSDFIKGPRAVAIFLKQSVRLEAPRHLGHNPAGGWMILALMAVLTGLVTTGIMMTTDAFWASKTVEDVHEVLANAAIVLIALHVLGVILASYEHGENLVSAMFSGRKRR